MRHTRLTETLSVGEIGLGCSSMSYGYGPARTARDHAESARVLRHAVDLGVTVFDTADVYGPFTNEQLLGEVLAPVRADTTIATKVGLVLRPDGTLERNGRPEYLREACEGSLKRLGVDAIGLYQLHRVDPDVPLTESWGALAELVTEGKVRGLGISHATVEELEQIHALFPIAAVQYELSVWERRNLEEILPWTWKNDVGFLACCPIGRGYLSGRVAVDELVDGDSRRRDPRFEAAALTDNQRIVDGLHRVAARHGATPAQVAIAWLTTHGDNVVPIPGTRRLRWLEENVGAAGIRLDAEDLRDIDTLPVATGEKRWDEHREPAVSK
ncbi:MULTISPECIES: aldo/keto reductase [unclassified Amycolatopsis]|uniref:aldo/keto reductase n=1 Tax=unclassified Amycolatopsis TaxID=2618356 RepID=UPI002E226AF4|nr:MULTISPECIES: aldo/keto reductase [unclassified Amycolatopsis]